MTPNPKPVSSSPLVLSRRASLMLLGAGAMVALPGFRTGARAQDVAAPRLLADGQLDLTAGFVFPDTPLIDLQAELGAPDSAVALPCTVPLLRLDDRLILFDVGSGPNFMPGAGALLASLESAGVAADEITDVVFTHCHPDHLWGVTDDFDEPAFPNAAYHLRQEEFNFWNDPGTVDRLPEETRAFAVGAAARLRRIADRVQLFRDGAEPLPGIEAMASPGHTPGHTSYVLNLAGDPLVITGDVLSHPLTIAHPDWRWGTDQEPAQAIETRKRVLDRLTGDKLRALVFHMDPPGVGRVEADGGAGLRWIPEG